MAAIEHDDENETFVPQPVVALEKGGGASIVDVLKSDLARIAENQFTFIPVAGYEKSRLQIKYRFEESGREVVAIGEKVFKETSENFQRALYAAMDTMITLCEGLYVQPEGELEPVELDPQEAGSPVKFDFRLAEIIGLTGDDITARKVLRKLFDNKELRIVAHADKLQRWLSGAESDAEQAFWSGE